MKSKTHFFFFFFFFFFFIFFLVFDYETHSISDLFLGKGNFVALVVYTILFMAVAYTGLWLWTQAKAVFKTTSSK